MVPTFLTSWEIISHNTVVWTGDVNLDYKIAACSGVVGDNPHEALAS